MVIPETLPLSICLPVAVALDTALITACPRSICLPIAVAEETAAKYTYQPRTEAGREYTKEVGEFMRETGLEGVAPTVAPTRVIPSVTGRVLTKTRPRVKDIPTIEGLKAESTNLYKQAKEAGIEFKAPEDVVHKLCRIITCPVRKRSR